MDQQSKTVKAQEIKAQEAEIEKTKKDIKTRKELIETHIEGLPTWLELESSKEEVKRLTAKFKQELGSDSEYNNQLEDLGQLKDRLKDQNETLSMMIVGYYLDTKEQQLETDSNGNARELVITGKLGKKAKYQTSLFAGK